MQIQDLVTHIDQIQSFFKQQVEKQVNTAFTLRNWLIGFYLMEYEQHGADRAAYGAQLLKTVAKQLKKRQIKGLSHTNLKLFRSFYQTYPQIGQTMSDQLQLPVGTEQKIRQSHAKTNAHELSPSISLLISNLSFSHFIELIKCEDALQRAFYETFSLNNNWTVRDLQRARTSLLYERTGLSTDKEAVLKNMQLKENKTPVHYLRDPYILEFLGLPEKESYKESDLEDAIITHLHNFLIELGEGYCFEARQKRMTFDNTHYRIDLVFYHRILKSHILIDLKIGDFNPADAGQMNMYLNYYRDNEMNEGDNPPVGIILCAGKNENLVKYATAGMSEQLFVSNYLLRLPNEAELKAIIEAELSKKA
jgi:predicted nuclease of restriction endonuclease-like (RecB) superfamily